MDGKDVFAALGHVREEFVTEAEEYTGRRVMSMHRVRWVSALAACMCLLVGWAVMVQWPDNPLMMLFSGGSANDSASSTECAVESSAATTEGAMEEETMEETTEEGILEEDTVGTEESPESGTGGASTSDSVIIVDHYTGDDKAIYCYGVPENGVWFCEEYLRQMVEKLEGSKNSATAAGADREVRFLVAFSLWKDGVMIDPESAEYTAEVERLIGLGYEFRILNVQNADAGAQVQICGLFTAGQLTEFDALEDYGYVLFFPEDEYGISLDWEDQAFLCGLPEADAQADSDAE